jgi:hypothetical protein
MQTPDPFSRMGFCNGSLNLPQKHSATSPKAMSSLPRSPVSEDLTTWGHKELDFLALPGTVLKGHPTFKGRMQAQKLYIIAPYLGPDS